MAAFSLSNATNLFKINYYKKSENMYNSYNVLHGRIKKRYDFTGKQRFVATPLSFSGGVGSGSLPAANVGNYGGATITAKKVYAVCEIDRESIKAAENDKGAFVRATKETVQKCVESYMRNCSRILFGDGSGKLGDGDVGTNVSGAGSVADPYVITITAASWKEANWEEKDFVNIDVETTNLEIVAVDPDLRQISLVGSSAILAADTGASGLAESVFMQGSKDNDPLGLDGILMATSGTLYGISVQRRWQATQEDAAGAGISVDLVNKVLLNIEKKFGKIPDLMVVSYVQMRKLLALMEGQKQFIVEPRMKELKSKLSFTGVEFMTSRGPLPIFADRFCEDDRIYLLNSNFIECHHRPGFGWFDDDGTVFLRKSDSDEYGARYGGYYENYITPTAHGVIHNLSVA